MLRKTRGLSPLHLLCDIILITASNILIFFSFFNYSFISQHQSELMYYITLSIGIRLFFFISFGTSYSIWRYISLSDAKVLLLSSIFTTIPLGIAVNLLISTHFVPSILMLADSLLICLALGSARVLRRIIYEESIRSKTQSNNRTALIYGTGVEGRNLAKQLTSNNQAGVKLVGFIDDDRKKCGSLVSGIKVLGHISDLEKILNEQPISELIIAMPSLQGKALRQILSITQKHSVRSKILNEFPKQSDDSNHYEYVREVRLEDLLARKPTSLDLSPVKEYFKNKKVLITGAGGSIGSEIARQVLSFQSVSRLLLLDSSELNLYQIDHELRGALSCDISKITPLLLDIRNKNALKKVFDQYRPDIIIHAAAYKHVHLVEFNPCSAIINNILGTFNLVKLSEEYNAENFILISTDKAVNPSSVMGATKRICEMLVAESGLKSGKRYCAVRFGNVVGSSGSLIPLLKKQIQQGKPLTITDPNMARYFMLIPEAVSLVLKAATISKPGDICILRMGEPVKIVDVAKNLRTLMGKAEEDAPIIFTGIRPGEKLCEELYLCGDELATEHPDILTLPKGAQATLTSLPYGKTFEETIKDLIFLAEESEETAVNILMSLVKAPKMAIFGNNQRDTASINNKATPDISHVPTTVSIPS